MNEKQSTEARLTPAEQSLTELWEKHLGEEFTTRDTDATLESMVPDAYVNHIPVLTGGVLLAALHPQDASRYGDRSDLSNDRPERLVGEVIFKFTHTTEMDWMLPGIAPTGKRVEYPLVVIVHFRDGKLANEHIYWDQATVLVQIGLLDPSKLSVVGVETVRKVANPRLPANHLIERAKLGGRSGN
jgi:carboxymethylenebutenolidase